MSRLSEKPGRYSRHFYSLDVLRGLAALGIVVWHWGQYFCGTGNSDPNQPRPPLDFVLWPVYSQGYRAVALFFCLSGFIFFWLYAESIAERRTSWREFAVLRLSRLYPLYFATLLAAALGQWVMMHWFGHYFVAHNDEHFHFFLQLIFVASWSSHLGSLYNGPSWSVSIEVLLYAVFFVICLLRFNRWWHLMLYMAIGYCLMHFKQPWLGTGFFSFFLGGLSYQLFDRLWRQGFSRFLVAGLIALTAFMWIAVPFNYSHNTLEQLWNLNPWRGSLLIDHKDLIRNIIVRVTGRSYELILFPLTILTLAICEAFRGTLGRCLAVLGNISYSVYLIHFPLLIVVAIGVHCFPSEMQHLYSAWALIGYFCILIPLALCSYYFFERPSQSYLRARLL